MVRVAFLRKVKDGLPRAVFHHLGICKPNVRRPCVVTYDLFPCLRGDQHDKIIFYTYWPPRDLDTEIFSIPHLHNFHHGAHDTIKRERVAAILWIHLFEAKVDHVFPSHVFNFLMSTNIYH